MEQKDIEKLLEGVAKENGKAIKDAVKTEMEVAVKGLMTSADFEKKMSEVGVKPGDMEKIMKALETQGEELRKVFEGKKQGPKSVSEVVEENKDAIKALAKQGAPGVRLYIPKTEITRASVTSSTMAMRLADVGQLPYLGTVMSSLFRHVQVSPSSNGVIRYIDQSTATRNGAATAESATKPESVLAWTERTLLIEKIADSIPVTKEAFNDVGFIAGEIDRLLNVNLALAVDSELWDGDGTTPNLAGVYTTAPTFNPLTYTGPGAVDATLYDLIAILRVEIMNGRQSKYSPNAVVMNPADILRYKLAKGSDGHYVLPPFISADGSVIDGVRVVESSQVTENTLAIGDFRYGTIYDLEGVTVEVGFINDQFVQNTRTILAEQRLGLLIRDVDATGFLKVTDIGLAINVVNNS